MTARERVEWLGRMTEVVFMLASAALLSAIKAMRSCIAFLDGETAGAGG
jgi:hypothetical protein